MAKKSRRARKKSVRSVSRVTVQPAEATETAAAATEAADQPEYSYVITDLRQVGILAAAMFALLIGLSFFIS